MISKPIAGTRFEIRSESSPHEFEDALRELPQIVAHGSTHHFDAARSRAVEVTVSEPAVEVRLLSAKARNDRKSPDLIRARMAGTLEGSDPVVWSGLLTTRRDGELILMKRVLPAMMALGAIAAVGAAPISTAVAFYPFAAFFLAGSMYVGAWLAVASVRRASAVEIARLLLLIGDVTHGTVEVQTRHFRGFGRIAEATALDLPGPLISQAMDHLRQGHSGHHR